jgi:hypothetical protein
MGIPLRETPMFRSIHNLALPLVLMASIASTTFAGDTVRPILRSSDRDDTRRLDLRPADEDTQTQEVCWCRGGFSVGYYGGYWPSYYGPYFSYYAPAFPYYYSPYYFGGPFVVSYGSYYPLVVANGRSHVRTESLRYDDTQTFRYDGGPDAAAPVEPIPPARDLDSLPAPDELKLGPAPTDRTIARPARSAKKHTYPAYGEDRAPTKASPRDAKTLLIRGPK